MQFKKIGRRVSPNETVTIYSASGTGYTIESRRRDIPHASRPGTWKFTSYFVIKDGEELHEAMRLTDAIEWAEKHARGEIE